mmetsp:Transcript_46373/g.91980  ORF Transcript_46373/g.91980 Transcript_46373/m.91980 type:complete len:706 (+) Transcript_46373:48-2165(+)
MKTAPSVSAGMLRVSRSVLVFQLFQAAATRFRDLTHLKAEDFVSALLVAGAETNTSVSKTQGDASSSFVSICGDNGELWEEITGPSSVRGIRAINWDDVGHQVDDYLGDLKVVLGTLSTTIQDLHKQIEQKEKLKGARTLTKKEIGDLVAAAVSHEEAFGEFDAAKTTKCGKPGYKWKGKRPNPSYQSGSINAMQSAADQFFGNSEVKSEVGIFTSTCEDALGFVRTGNPEDDDLASYCDELCSELAKVVQDVSNARAAKDLSSLDRLKRALAKQRTAAEAEHLKQTECEAQWMRISDFKDYILGLQDDMSVKYKAVQAAQWALSDAQDVLAQAGAQLDAQQELAQSVSAKLHDLGQAVDSAQGAIAPASRMKDDIDIKAKATSDELDMLNGELEALRAAKMIASDLKERVSFLLLKMDAYTEESVRQPVREIGLAEETDVYNGFFERDVSIFPEAGYVDGALGKFYGYCENEAQRIFAKVMKHVDLRPLCDLAPEATTSKELLSAVQERSEATVESVQRVQTWLNPFKGTDLTKDTEATKYVDQGEPLGLRRIFSVYHNSGFHREYLTHWKLNGKFLKLLKKANMQVSMVDKQVKRAQETLIEMQRDMLQAQAQYKEAIEALMSLEHSSTALQGEKEAVQAELEKLKAAHIQAQTSLQDLEERVAEAVRQWEASKKTLLTEHGKVKDKGTFGSLEQVMAKRLRL